MSTEKLTHEIAASQPDRYKILANGAVYGLQEKHIVLAPPKEKQFITHENASALATQYWDEKRAEWVEGGEIAANTLEKAHLGAWRAIGENIATLAMTKQDRTAVEAARLYGQNAGYVQDRSRSDAGQPQTVNIQAFLGNDVLRELVARRIMAEQAEDE